MKVCRGCERGDICTGCAVNVNVLVCQDECMRRHLPFAILLLSLTLCAHAGDAFHMPAELPPIEKRDSWQQSLDEIDARNVPVNWSLIGPLPDKDFKLFDLPDGMEPDRSDDWSKQKTIPWTRARDDDGPFMDLAEALNERREVLAYAKTEIDWPVDGPALIWFDYFGRVAVHVNGQRVGPPAMRKREDRKDYEPTKYTMAPIQVNLKRGKNVLKLKIGQDRKPAFKGFGFFVRLERNDLPYRLALFARLKQLYPEEAKGWRGIESLMELARRYEAENDRDRAAAMYQQAAELCVDDDSARIEAESARQRVLSAAKQETSDQIWANWKKTDEQFKAMMRDTDTLGADALLRDYIARYPLHESAGNALVFRGGLRHDYGFNAACQRFYERALREWSQNDFVRRFSLNGLAFARLTRGESPNVETRRDYQAVIDGARRQLGAGDEEDIGAAVRSFTDVLDKAPGTLLQISDSLFFPRYVGAREYLRALLAHLAGKPLAMYRKSVERIASARLDDALRLGGVAELEALVAQYYFTAAAATALNRAGNMYMDRGAWPQALHAFRTLQRDFRGVSELSEAELAAKIARVLALDGQGEAALDANRKLAADFSIEKIAWAGESLNGAEVARKLDALAKGPAATPIEHNFAETFASNVRRTGPPAQAPSPKPGAVAWSVPATPSRSANTAKSFWPEDSIFPHIQPYPVVSGNRVFLSTLESLECFEAASGKTLWRQNWDSQGSLFPPRDGGPLFTGFPVSCPTIANENVYLRVVKGSQSSIRCHRAADGALLWSTDKESSVKKLVFLSDPAIAYGLAVAVYLDVPADLNLEPGQSAVNTHGLIAFDAESGQVRWKRPLATGAMGRVMEHIAGREQKQYATYRSSMQLGPPAADGGIIYSGTGLGSLAALNAFTGEVIWLSGYPQLRSESLENGNSSIDKFLPRMLRVLARGPASPIVGEDVVVLAPKDATGVIAFERQSGQIRWMQELNDARYLAGICNGNLLTVDNRVQAISIATGKIEWEYALQGANKLLGNPGFSGSMLYLATSEGLQSLDARSGKRSANLSWDPKNGPLGNLALAGTTLFGVNSKWLVAISPAKP